MWQSKGLRWEEAHQPLLGLGCSRARAAQGPPPSSLFLPGPCRRLLLLSTPSSKDKHCFGIRTLDSWNKLCLATLLDTDVSNPMEYEFNFQLEIRGPCLLAGEKSAAQTWPGT